MIYKAELCPIAPQLNVVNSCKSKIYAVFPFAYRVIRKCKVKLLSAFAL